MNHRRGHCYAYAAEFVLQHPEYLLAHGTCTGRGPIAGERFGHAWCEVRTADGVDVVFDVVSGKYFRRDAYYEAGEITHTRRYSAGDVMRKLLETKHYGPWCKKIQTASHD